MHLSISHALVDSHALVELHLSISDPLVDRDTVD